MGSRGPVPNRSEDLSRDRDANRGDRPAITKGKSRPASVPEPDPTWHPIARLLWDATIESGQADFYESSDYAFLFSICDDVSYYKHMGKRSGQMLASIYSAMENLLVTEGARRRVRVELQDDVEEDAEVVDMDARRRQIGLVS